MNIYNTNIVIYIMYIGLPPPESIHPDRARKIMGKINIKSIAHNMHAYRTAILPAAWTIRIGCHPYQ